MRQLIAFPLLFAAAPAFAELKYSVDVRPDAKQLHVAVQIPNPGGKDLQLQSPNWAPGSYRYADNFQAVLNLKATDGSGKSLSVTQDKFTWTVQGADTVVVEYDLASNPLAGAFHWSGPSTYLYPVGRTQEPCRLTVTAPGSWIPYCGLDAVGNAPNIFSAPTYDVLADNPVSIGDVLVRTYTSHGKPHFIVMRGEPKTKIDANRLTAVCQYISDFEGDFYGGLPFNKYIWHFNVIDSQDGGGGLEHLSSTQITLASGLGYGSVGVLAHEYFHLWNVKRIRSEILGPFDYTTLPQTGALWWLEGVTDYYAHYLLYRYAQSDRAQFYRQIGQNFLRNRNYPQHADVSLHDASYRVREAANGRGNSQGFGMSYYDGGWLAGMILDIELRSRTGGGVTLDNVQKELWARFQRNPARGFGEDDLRTILQEKGGFSMGFFYDSVIMKASEKPTADALAKVGLSLGETQEKVLGLGVLTNPVVNEGLRVSMIGTAAPDALRDGDMIISLNGKSLALATRQAITGTLNSVMSTSKAGQDCELMVKRADQNIPLRIKVAESTRSVFQAAEIPDASQAAVRLREQWLRQTPLASRPK